MYIYITGDYISILHFDTFKLIQPLSLLEKYKKGINN